MTGFSGLAWRNNLALYDRVLALPFNQELLEGSLALHCYPILDRSGLEFSALCTATQLWTARV
jgi:hypothetical protein